MVIIDSLNGLRVEVRRHPDKRPKGREAGTRESSATARGLAQRDAEARRADLTLKIDLRATVPTHRTCHAETDAHHISHKSPLS